MNCHKSSILKFLFIAIHALVITWGCYIAGNIPYSFGTEKQTVKWFNAILGWFNYENYTAPNNVLPINVSYDKQLIEVSDKYGLPLGVTDITDRYKLQKLLHLIDSIGNYKYIVCDILFSGEYITPADSALFELISKMPRIAVAGGVNTEDVYEKIRSKAFPCTYSTTIEEGDFVKYPLLSNGKESLPLHLWKSIHETSFWGNAFFCQSQGRMCRKSIFLDFPIRVSELYSGGQLKSWLNLGVDILDVRHMLNLEALFKDKIILIGSFTEDDIHSTIAGDMPGVMINYNAYYALSQGRHYLNIIAFFILFLVFFITTVSVLNDKHLSDYIPQRLIPESTVIQMLISWVSLSTLFTVVFFILYMVFKEVYDIFFISTYFTLLRTIKQILSAKQL